MDEWMQRIVNAMGRDLTEEEAERATQMRLHGALVTIIVRDLRSRETPRATLLQPSPTGIKGVVANLGLSQEQIAQQIGPAPDEGWLDLASEAGAAASGTLKGKTIAEWYIAYCEASERHKADQGAIERYSKLVTDLQAQLARQSAAAPALADVPRHTSASIANSMVGQHRDASGTEYVVLADAEAAVRAVGSTTKVADILREARELLAVAAEPDATQAKADAGMVAHWDVEALALVARIDAALAGPRGEN